MARNCIQDPEERDPQSGSRFDNRKVRKRRINQRSYSSIDVYVGNRTSVEMESGNTKSIKMQRYELPDISTFEPKQNHRCCWRSSPSRTKEPKKNPTRTSTMEFEMTGDDIHACRIGEDESKVRDKCAVFDEDDFETGIVGNNFLPSRLYKLKHRLSRLNKFFNSRNEERNSMRRKHCSFDVILVMISLRFMSKSRFCLERGYDGPLVPNHSINMEFVKNLIDQIIRWMHANKFIERQEKNCQLHLRSYSDSNHASSVQHLISNSSDSCTCSADSSICQNGGCLDLSNYIAPEYVRIFLKSLDETIDLTPDYIHAHNRTEFHDIENDDDGMSGELRNLHFIEREIEKELTELETQNKVEFSTEKVKETSPFDLECTDGETATDAFYNAFIAITSESSSASEEDTSSDDGSESTFDVQNARETVLELVAQIQSRLPQKNSDETSQKLPEVQQKIMKNLLILSDNPNPPEIAHTSKDSETSYEISIGVTASLSSIGCDLELEMIDDDVIDNNCTPDALERSDSKKSSASKKMHQVLNRSSEGIGKEFFPDFAVQDDRNEDYQSFCTPHEVSQGMRYIEDNFNIPGRIRKTIWTTLLDRRQKSTQKSDRRSPFPPKPMMSNTVSSYLQLKKERSPRGTNQDYMGENSSIAIQNSLDVESKYYLHENIRESQENDNSIEVILKENFEISRIEDILSPSTNCPDESHYCLSTANSNSNRVNMVCDSETEIYRNKKTTDLRKMENTSYMTGMENAIIGIHTMHDESSKTADNHLEDIAWSLSPTIDPFGSNTSELAPTLTRPKSPEITFVQNNSVSTQSINSDVDDFAKPTLYVTTDDTLRCIEEEHLKIQTEGPRNERENLILELAPSLVVSKSSEITFAQNKIVNTQMINSDINNYSNPILSVTTDNILRCIEEENLRIQTKGPRNKRDNAMDTRSSKLSDYWNSLLTHSFSHSFEENIENEPIYVVHSNFNPENIKNDEDISIRSQCQPIFKDDPSGQYSMGDYSDSDLDSNLSKGNDGICSIGQFSRHAEGSHAISKFDDSIHDKYNEYNSFETARKIPKVYSEADSNVENLEQIILSGLSDSAETVYFDTEYTGVRVGVVEPSFEAIEISDSLSTLYYTLPSLDCINE